MQEIHRKIVQWRECARWKITW